MILKDEWYNGQGKFDLSRFVQAEIGSNYRWHATSFNQDTGMRVLKMRGLYVDEEGTLYFSKNTDGTLAENSVVPRETFGVQLYSVSKVSPVLALRDPTNGKETRTSMFAHTRMKGMLAYDSEASQLVNIPKYWNDMYWDLNDSGKLKTDKNCNDSWGSPNGFTYISDEDRPHFNKFWNTLTKAHRAVKQVGYKVDAKIRTYSDSSLLVNRAKSLEQMAMLTEEEILTDMMDTSDGGGVTWYIAERGKKDFMPYVATHSDTRIMEVL